MPDTKIWELAQANNLVIVTKDADFSHRVLASTNGPKLIHLRIGNMLMREMDSFVCGVWPEAVAAIGAARLVRIYLDRIEVIA